MNELAKGSTLRNGKYEIESTLGQGSFGIIYLARTEVSITGDWGPMYINIYVTIKEFFMSGLNSRSSDGITVEAVNSSLVTYYRKNFHQEAELLGKLNHRNIVKVLEMFDENNTTYYVMEHINGESLDDYIKKRGRIPEQEAIEAFIDIGTALQHMHYHNMLHLDIKPKNVMRNQDGHLVLIDFGHSKQYDQNGMPESSTTIGAGTPGYAPIEQGHLKQDGSFPATLDIYALGATLFKMLTGTTPPLAIDILEEGFPKQLLQDAGVSDNTISIVEKAMHPMKKQRYQTVNDMIDQVFFTKIEKGESQTEQFGSYKQYIGESEYGTLEIVHIPVVDPLPMPTSITIEYRPLAPGKLAFTFWLNTKVCNTALVERTEKDGEKTVLLDEDYRGGIEPSTIEALKQNGFFSKEHWEEEESTYSPLDDDTFVKCTFFFNDGRRFVRKVVHANKIYHRLLLDAVENLAKTPQIKQVLDGVKKREIHPNQAESEGFSSPSHPLIIAKDTTSVKITYDPEFPKDNEDKFYHLSISPQKMTILSDTTISKRRITPNGYQKFLTDLQGLGLIIKNEQVPSYRSFSKNNSTDPTYLIIRVTDKHGESKEYWIGGWQINQGNIVGDIDDIRDIKDSIIRIIPKITDTRY